MADPAEMQTVSEPERSQAPTSPARKFGAVTLAAIIVGVAISQVGLVGVLQSLGIAGHFPAWMQVVAFLIAYLLALGYAATFAELSLMMPSTGGLSTYTEVAIGNFPAMLATYAGYVVVNIFGVPAELMLFDSVAREVGGLHVPPKSLALALLAILTCLNIRGTDAFAALQNASSLLKVGLMLATGVAAYLFLPGALPVSTAVQVAVGGSVGFGFGLVVGLFFWCFVGAEFVCPMIGEVEKPSRAIPLSMMLGITALAVLYGLYAMGARRLVPDAVLSGSTFPHLEYAKIIFGRVGSAVLLLMATAATIGLVNAILAGVSRLLHGMALNGQAFSPLSRLHSRHRSPWVATLALAGCFAATILLVGDRPETITDLVVAASTSWLLAYVIAHLDLVVLRRRYPDARRPWRSPWFPLPQLVGIAGMLYVIASNPDDVNRMAGYVLLPVAVMSAFWTRFVMKRGLFAPQPLQVDA